MTEQLMGYLEVGEEWVIYLLLATSVICVAIVVDRAIFLARFKGKRDVLKGSLRKFLATKDIEGARKHFEAQHSVPARVMAAALRATDRSPEALQEVIEGEELEQRGRLERGLDFLGTVGSNAPFVGLFGTVLGIIQAFRDLAVADTAGPQVVMAGISAALVATAIGLLVAIPALVAYNFFKGQAKKVFRTSDVLSKQLLSYQLDRVLGCPCDARDEDCAEEGDPEEDAEGSGKFLRVAAEG
jgi:biopolymer transport protein ExbB